MPGDGDDVIKLDPIELIDLEQKFGPGTAHGIQLHSQNLLIYVGDNLNMYACSNLGDKRRLYINDDDVTHVAEEGEHFNERVPVYFKSGAILWNEGNAIEYILFR